MPRAQVSFEFLIYVAVSAVALVLVLSLFIRGNSTLAYINGKSSLEGLVALINTNMAFQRASFSSYIPEEACSFQFGSRSIEFDNQSYLFTANVSIDKEGICAYAGTIALVNITELQNGAYLVSFSGSS